MTDKKTSYDNIVIELSKDRLKAFMTLVPGENMIPPTINMILGALQKHNITHFINKKEIENRSYF